MKIKVQKYYVLLIFLVFTSSSCRIYSHKINYLKNDGAKQGLWITTDTIANIYITKYQNGVRDGKFKAFHSNGKIKSIGKYKDDKRIGVWKFYFDNGFLYKELKFDKKGEQKSISLYDPIDL